MTWTIRPMFAVVSVSGAALCWLAVAVMSCSCPCRVGSSALESGRAAHDLGNFLRDARLALLVVRAAQEVHQVGRVVGRALHGGAARAVLARRGLGEAAIERVLHVKRQQLGEDRLGARREE